MFQLFTTELFTAELFTATECLTKLIIPSPFSMVESREISEAGVSRTLFRLGWPMMVSSFMHAAYNLVDMLWLGHLPGEEGRFAIAALQISWPIVFFMISLGLGLGIAGIALVSQYTGAKNREMANRSAGQLLSLTLLLSILVAIVGFLITGVVVRSIGADAPVTIRATNYIRIIFLGMPFMFSFMSFTMVLRGYGDTITPMKIGLVAVGLNVILDPLLIFGIGFPPLGVRGAAIATVISRAIAAIPALYLLFSGRVGVHVRPGDLKPDGKVIKKILSIGIPASADHTANAFGFFVLMYIVARLNSSTIALAAYGIGDRIINMMFIVIDGLAFALTIIIGQNLGAGRIDRAMQAARKGIGLMFCLLLASSVLLYLLRRGLMGAFTPDVETIDEGINFLRIVSLAIPFFGIFRGVGAIYEGSGHTVPAMILGLSRLWVLRLPLCYWLGLHWGLQASGVWWGMALSNAVSAALALGVYSTGIWKKKVIE